MSNITNYLNKVKTAIYGKDVRGAIHDAIKQVYDDASVDHDNANMEVKLARGTHNTLNDRLDNVDEIQAQTNAQLSDINHEINVTMPCGEFEIPSDMPCDFPFKIRRDIDGVIRHNATFDDFKTNSIDYYVDTVNGNDNNDGTTSSTAFKTLGKAILSVKDSSCIGNFKIMLSGFVSGGDAMKYCDSDIWTIGNNKTISLIGVDNPTISTGYESEKYLSFWEDSEGIKYLNKPDEEFTFVFNNKVLDVYNQPTPLKRVKSLEECKSTKESFYSIPVAKGGGLYVNSDYAIQDNLLNPYNCKLGYALTSTGEIESTTYNPATSQFMNIKGNTSYTLVNAHSPGTNICWYDENKKFISNVKITESSLADKPLTAISPENAKYARVTVYPNSYYGWHDKVKFYDNSSFGVHPISGSVIDSNTNKYGTNLAIELGKNSRLYLENINLLSGDICNVDELFTAGVISVRGTIEPNNTNSLWLNRCSIIGGAVGGLDSNGHWNATCDSVAGLLSREISVYSFNCICAHNGTDAMSYGADPTYNNRIAFEYQNVIYDTLGGINGSTANASTCHNYFNRISVGVIAKNASGPVFADVGGCYSIFIDCHAKNAGVGVSNTANRIALYHADANKATAEGFGRTGKIVLINCTAYGSGVTGLNVDGTDGKYMECYVSNFKTNKKINSNVPIQKYEF